MSDEGTPTPFAGLDVPYRVFAVEDVRRRLRELAEKAGYPHTEDPVLSAPAEAWLKRLRSALADPECTTASVVEMDAAMHEALPEDEDKKVHHRLIEFEAISDGIPLTATNTEEAIGPVIEHLHKREAARA
jgi:hypothetical protein